MKKLKCLLFYIYFSWLMILDKMLSFNWIFSNIAVNGVCI